MKIKAANDALDCFAKGTTISIKSKVGVIVSWTRRNGETVSKRWMTKGQDFYPIWHNKWGHGGTCSTALAQLVRWVKNKPVLPISTWKYWTAPQCYLARDRGPELIKILTDGEYPEHAICVLCKNQIEGSLDWWSLDKVTGPCCGWTTGCRQNINFENNISR